MSAASITPGPWEASDRTDSHEIYSAAYPGTPIAHVGSYWQGPGPRRNERAANAKAIAAVPAMIEALQAVMECPMPERVSLYDEEGVEGWCWTAEGGREWSEIGSWDESPPVHPMVKYALRQAGVL